MSIFTRAVAVRALALAAAAGAGVGGTMAMTSGAHESIQIALGDTVAMKFAIRTDTVLALAGGSNIVARRCGTSMLFFRTLHGTAPISADSVAVNVPCSSPPPIDTTPHDTTTAARSIQICYIPTDSATKYNIPTLQPGVGGLGLSREQRALIDSWGGCKNADTLPLPMPRSLGRKA